MEANALGDRPYDGQTSKHGGVLSQMEAGAL